MHCRTFLWAYRSPHPFTIVKTKLKFSLYSTANSFSSRLEGTAKFLISSLPVIHCQPFKHQSWPLVHTAMTQRRERQTDRQTDPACITHWQNEPFYKLNVCEMDTSFDLLSLYNYLWIFIENEYHLLKYRQVLRTLQAVLVPTQHATWILVENCDNEPLKLT